MSNTQVFVYSMSRAGEVGAWSRYLFPFAIDNFCQKDDNLYIRAGDDVLMVDETATQDFQDDARAQSFDGVVQWPWLDLGQPGVTKSLAGIDVSSMNASSVQVEIGPNQADTNAFTAPALIVGDTVPGRYVPIPVVGPSFSVRLTYSSLQKWQLLAVTLYLNDQRPMA